jgi:hypothetical protein
MHDTAPLETSRDAAPLASNAIGENAAGSLQTSQSSTQTLSSLTHY